MANKTANPRTAFEDVLAAERVAARTERGLLKLAAYAATVKVFLMLFTSYVTQFDQKLERKQPNIYRLGHYLSAVNKVQDALKSKLDDDDEAAMDALKAALAKNFDSDFPPLKKIQQSIEAWVNDKKLPKLGKI